MTGSKVVLIAAVDDKMTIGKDGKIPWKIEEDTKFFREKTMNNVVLMGRKTFESIGKPLVGRKNVVVSRSIIEIPGCKVFSDFDSAMRDSLRWAEKYKRDVYVIGGGEVYREALKYADRLVLSHVRGDYSGNVSFPDISAGWEVSWQQSFVDSFDVKTWVRKSSNEKSDLLMKKGLLVDVEGIDGSGKTEVVSRIAAWLASKKFHDFSVMSFPRYKTETGEKIKRALQNKDFLFLEPKEASKLYSEDRRKAKDSIFDALESEAVVLLNRYVMSNWGHQGSKLVSKEEQREFFNWSYDLEFVQNGLPEPDLTILLNLPARISQERALKRDSAGDSHQDSLVHLEKASKTYLEAANFLGDGKVKVIDCFLGGRELSIEEVSEAAIAVVREEMEKRDLI
jgi:dihydrofolate reductase